jgi:DNA-binding response OmpR family regulator
MKILIAEDDDLTRRGLRQLLEGEGYAVVEARDGEEALRLEAGESPDLLLLDIMMPRLDGFEVCRRIRARSRAVPILFLSAKGEEIDRVVGLELGADDFISKPFGTREVVARIRAVTRRTLASRAVDGGDDCARFRMGDLEVAPDELRAFRGELAVDLSLRDVRILRLFAANPGKVLDRNLILNCCWGVDYLPSSRTLDQHIAQLRKKIEVDPAAPTLIRTVHGAGYRYDGSAPSSPVAMRATPGRK